MLDKIKTLWPALTSFAMAGLIVAKGMGYFTNLSEVQAETLMATAGSVLAALALRSGTTAIANASLVASATSASNMAMQTANAHASALGAQASALQDASRAVITAAAAVPTPMLIAAAGEAAGAVLQVIEDAKVSIDGVKSALDEVVR